VEEQGAATQEISRKLQQFSNITDVQCSAREGSASQVLSASRSCASRCSALATISSRVSRPTSVPFATQRHFDAGANTARFFSVFLRVSN
jgi:hypothetical protein